jgi:hypothetical protein
MLKRLLLFSSLEAGRTIMKNHQNPFDQDFFQPTTTGKNYSSQDFFQPTTSGNTYPSQGETTSGERYSSFQDEQLPWDNAAQSTPKTKKNRSDFFQSNQNISSHANASSSASLAPQQSSFQASRFRHTMPLPAKCEWIETTPYRVLKVGYKSPAVLIFGIAWFAMSIIFMNILAAERGGFLEILKGQHDDLLFLLFPAAGIILMIAGVYYAFANVWITCKGNILEIEKGLSRKGKTKSFYRNSACVEAFENSSNYNRRNRYSGVVYYKVKITDPDSNTSMILADNLNAQDMNIFMDYIQYLLDQEV